eukprot:360078-Chlamydomonas_euryale.AAC.16
MALVCASTRAAVSSPGALSRGSALLARATDPTSTLHASPVSPNASRASGVPACVASACCSLRASCFPEFARRHLPRRCKAEPDGSRVRAAEPRPLRSCGAHAALQLRNGCATGA